MMSYAFTVTELDASQFVNPVDFLARVAAADGMNFFGVTVACFRNGSTTKKDCQSPYFKADDPKARSAIFKELMKRTAREILTREESLPPDEQPPREPLIVVP